MGAREREIMGEYGDEKSTLQFDFHCPAILQLITHARGANKLVLQRDQRVCSDYKKNETLVRNKNY